MTTTNFALFEILPISIWRVFAKINAMYQVRTMIYIKKTLFNIYISPGENSNYVRLIQ